MFQRILVPLDGSPGAERAIPVAARIARSAGGSLVFLHVISLSAMLGNTPIPPRKAASEVEREEQALTDAADYLAAAIATYAEELTGVPTEMDVAFGLTSPTLSSTARLEQVDLVVMCSHREAGLGQWGIESIAQQTMHRSPVPLLILNEHGEMPQPDAAHPLRVIVPLDGSLFAETALEPALHIISQLAGSAQGELCLVRVVEDRRSEKAETQKQAQQEAEEYLDAISKRLDKGRNTGRDFPITSLVRISEQVATAILGQAEETGYIHLIIMATHGREGMQRLVLGSVAEGILGATTCSLLIVCPRSATARTAKPGQLAVGKM